MSKMLLRRLKHSCGPMSVTSGDSMGIFDDEEKKMMAEVASSERKEAQQKAELAEIAASVAQDVTNYAGTRLQNYTITVGVHENVVTIEKKGMNKAVQVICKGRETFQVTVDGHTEGAQNQSAMARAVIAWLKR
jgi:hypothetical protein